MTLKEIKKLIGENKVEQALSQLEKSENVPENRKNEIVLLKRRLENFKRNERLGVSTDNAELNAIAYALINFIDDLGKSEMSKNGNTPPAGTAKIKKLLLQSIAAIAILFVIFYLAIWFINYNNSRSSNKSSFPPIEQNQPVQDSKPGSVERQVFNTGLFLEANEKARLERPFYAGSVVKIHKPIDCEIDLEYDTKLVRLKDYPNGEIPLIGTKGNRYWVTVFNRSDQRCIIKLMVYSTDDLEQ